MRSDRCRKSSHRIHHERKSVRPLLVVLPTGNAATLASLQHGRSMLPCCELAPGLLLCAVQTFHLRRLHPTALPTYQVMRPLCDHLPVQRNLRGLHDKCTKQARAGTPAPQQRCHCGALLWAHTTTVQRRVARICARGSVQALGTARGARRDPLLCLQVPCVCASCGPPARLDGPIHAWQDQAAGAPVDLALAHCHLAESVA